MTTPVGRRSPFVVAALMAALMAGLAAATFGQAHAQAPLPQPRTDDGVVSLSGGVSDEEVQFIKQSMKDYSMALTFSRASGEFLANIAVTVKDARGKTVFEAPAAGPYLLLKLPAGRYSVVADYHGDTKTRPVTAIGRASTPVNFSWP